MSSSSSSSVWFPLDDGIFRKGKLIQDFGNQHVLVESSDTNGHKPASSNQFKIARDCLFPLGLNSKTQTDESELDLETRILHRFSRGQPFTNAKQERLFPHSKCDPGDPGIVCLYDVNRNSNTLTDSESIQEFDTETIRRYATCFGKVQQPTHIFGAAAESYMQISKQGNEATGGSLPIDILEIFKILDLAPRGYIIVEKTA